MDPIVNRFGRIHFSGGPVITRSSRALALAVGSATAAALFLAPAAPAAPQHAQQSRHDLGTQQLHAAARAVDATGVRGIAWYVDTSTDRVVVTADRTVSKAELAKVVKAAGGVARVER